MIATIVSVHGDDDDGYYFQALYLDDDLVCEEECISAHSYAMKTLNKTVNKLKYREVHENDFHGSFPDYINMNVWYEEY